MIRNRATGTSDASYRSTPLHRTNYAICLACVSAFSGCHASKSHQARVKAAHPPAQAITAAGVQPAGVHNVFKVAPGLLSGSVPEREDGFVQLKELGVQTVLSVDGATPDVEAARRLGMRYVHVPIGYHGIDPARQLEIARVVRDLPKPVYVHCHHGKHRGPAAAASAAVALDLLAPEEGVAFMKQAGTSDSYAGLYACVRQLHPATKAELDAAPANFPEIAPVPGFVKAMSQVQDAYDHLIEIRDAGWKVPESHPDLVPLAEAGQLKNLIRLLQKDARRHEHPPDFAQMLDQAWDTTRGLESAMTIGLPHEELNRRLAAVNASCKSCHTIYRNTR